MKIVDTFKTQERKKSEAPFRRSYRVRVYMLKDTDGLIIEDGIREFDEGIRLKRLNPGSRLEGIFR
jgi:hypothetical protein